LYKKADQEKPSSLFLKEVLPLLRCPLCIHLLQYNEPENVFLCSHCGTLYPVEKGIPVFLPPEGIFKREKWGKGK
jgi:uncharacterized protein YbaR (Trm112 family)